MFPRVWTRKELALIAAIVALACVAALLSIKLTRPRLLSIDTLGVERHCKHSILSTNCIRFVRCGAPRLRGPSRFVRGRHRERELACDAFGAPCA